MKKKIIWQSIVIAIGVIVLIALCFYVWKSPEVYSQGMAIVISAALGAILTAIITRMVIGSQLQSEQEKEKNIKIYEMKLQVYSEFISEMWSLYNDGEIDEKELIILRSKVFNKLIFLLKKEDFKELTDCIEQLRKSSDNELSKERVTQLLGQITRLLRKDMNLSDTSKDNPLVSLWNAFTGNLTIEAEKPEEKPITPLNKKLSIQTDRNYWHMNMVDSSIQAKALKNHIYELSLIEWETDKRTNVLKEIRKGDLIFLYNKGNMFLGIFETVGRRIFYYEGEQLLEEFIPDLDLLNKRENILPITWWY